MYKFADKEHQTVKNLLTGATGIHPGVWLWEEYQKWVDAGGITEPYKTQAELEADALQEQINAAIQARWQEIKAAREASTLKQYTVAQAETYINNKLNAATTVATMKEAVRDILLKMVPYVLE